MRGVTYYQRMFLLPLLVLVCSIPLGNHPSLFPDLKTWGNWVVFVGLPYLLTLAIFARTWRNGSETRLLIFSFRIPMLTGVMQVVFGGIVGVGYQWLTGKCLDNINIHNCHPGMCPSSCIGGIYMGMLVALLTMMAGFIYFICVNLSFGLLSMTPLIQKSNNDSSWKR